MLADGNGDYHTLNQYKEMYPEYPDPEFIMRLEERIPPKKGNAIEVGRREIVKIG